MKELKIRLMERMVSAGLTAHLGYEAGAARAAAGGAARGEESEAIAAEGGHDGAVWWGFGGVSRSGRFGKV